jgi:hypothetical protein
MQWIVGLVHVDLPLQYATITRIIESIQVITSEPPKREDVDDETGTKQEKSRNKQSSLSSPNAVAQAGQSAPERVCTRSNRRGWHGRAREGHHVDERA